MELRMAGADDASALQLLIESDPGYAERVTGYPPGAADAQSLLLGAPDGVPPDRKAVLLARDGERLVAAIDLVRGYPDAERAFVGLLLVDRAEQGRGIGTAVLTGAIGWIARSWPEIGTLRLSVVDTNAVVEPFWRARGFHPTGESRPYRYDGVESTSRLWERPLLT